jgi:hypothetical protein
MVGFAPAIDPGGWSIFAVTSFQTSVLIPKNQTLSLCVHSSNIMRLYSLRNSSLIHWTKGEQHRAKVELIKVSDGHDTRDLVSEEGFAANLASVINSRIHSRQAVTQKPKRQATCRDAQVTQTGYNLLLTVDIN